MQNRVLPQYLSKIEEKAIYFFFKSSKIGILFAFVQNATGFSQPGANSGYWVCSVGGGGLFGVGGVVASKQAGMRSWYS